MNTILLLSDALNLNTIMPFFGNILAETTSNSDFVGGLRLIGAGIAVFTCFGSSIGQGYAAGKAVEAVSRNPEVTSKIRTQFIIGAAVAESGAIYGLVVALLLIYAT